MKLTRNTLLSTALLSLVLTGQTATAGDAPEELNVYAENSMEQAQQPRVNFSFLAADQGNNTLEIFPDNEH